MSSLRQSCQRPRWAQVNRTKHVDFSIRIESEKVFAASITTIGRDDQRWGHNEGKNRWVPLVMIFEHQPLRCKHPAPHRGAGGVAGGGGPRGYAGRRPRAGRHRSPAGGRGSGSRVKFAFLTRNRAFIVLIFLRRRDLRFFLGRLDWSTACIRFFCLFLCHPIYSLNFTHFVGFFKLRYCHCPPAFGTPPPQCSSPHFGKPVSYPATSPRSRFLIA